MSVMGTAKKKYSKLPVPVKASLWFMVCSLTSKSISVVSTMILTRLMSTEQYGLVSLYNSWFEIVYVIGSLNLSVGVFNVGMTKFENDRERWMTTLCFLSLATSIVFSAIFILLYRYSIVFVQLPPFLIVFMLTTIFPSTAYNIWIAGQRYKLNYRKMVFVTLLYSVIILLIGTSTVFLFEAKGEAKILSNGIVIIVLGIILFIRMYREANNKFSKEYATFAFKYNVQMFPAFISAFVLNQMDRIMIENMCGRSQQGVYSFAYNAAIMISVVGTSLSAVFNPWFMQRVKERRFTNIAYISNVTASLFFMSIVAFVMIAPEVVYILGTKEYGEAVYIIPAVAGSTFFSLIYTFYCPILQYNLKTSILSGITVIAAITNFVLNYVSIQKWGYIAAGYTTFVCYLIYGWGTAFFATKTSNEQGYGNNIFNHKYLLLLSALLLVLSASVNYLYNHFRLRVGVLIILVLGTVVFRKKLIQAIMTMKG